jgi:hypothetical protein
MEGLWIVFTFSSAIFVVLAAFYALISIGNVLKLWSSRSRAILELDIKRTGHLI